MFTVQVLTLWILASAPSIIVARCPTLCQCDTVKKRVSCLDKKITPEQLKNIAKSLPLDTEKLFFNENMLTYFPTSAFQNFTKVDVLWLGNNVMNVFPKNLSSLIPSLKQIYMNQNKFTKIKRECLKGYENIVTIDLFGNGITELAEYTFGDCKNLKQIFLEKNEITKVSKYAFSGLNKLTDLTLESNLLTSIPVGTFNELTEIKRLWLKNNSLTEIPSGLLSPLSKAHNIYLSHNIIATIGASAFSGEPDIDLSNNKIKKLYKSTFQNVTVYKKLSLDNNPIDCDCNLYEVYHFLKRKKPSVKITGLCQSPSSVINATIESVIGGKVFNCTDCKFNPCKNNGNCNAVGLNYSCVCLTDYEGKYCEDKNVCASYPCLNNGTCQTVNKTAYRCNCVHDGFYGSNCEKERMCWKNPCLNNGSCISVNETNFKCNCSSGYKGDTCQHKNNIGAVEEKEEKERFKVEWIIIIALATVACFMLIVSIVVYRRKARRNVVKWYTTYL